MVSQRQKYILKSPYKNQLIQVVEDIIDNNLDTYHQVALQGYDRMYRIRVWDLRIVYQQTNQGNRIKYIWPRGDIYKML